MRKKQQRELAKLERSIEAYAKTFRLGNNGIRNGLQRAAEFMHQQAATAFRMGWDEKAKDRRTQAKNLEDMANKVHAEGERILAEAIKQMRLAGLAGKTRERILRHARAPR